MLVENSFGKLIDFDLASEYMDEELCDDIYYYYSPVNEQEFFDIYCERHFEKFGKKFEFDRGRFNF